MRFMRRGAAAALLMAAIATTTAGAAPPGPLPDWPCPGVVADQLRAEDLWPGPLPQSIPEREAWLADPQSRQLVEFIADPENSPAAGGRRIAEFAQANGKLRPGLAML